jgi:hypothetical protein
MVATQVARTYFIVVSRRNYTARFRCHGRLSANV